MTRHSEFIVNNSQGDSGDYIPCGEDTFVRPDKTPIQGESGENLHEKYFLKTRQQQNTSDKYLLGDKIAQGSMGSIHRVFDKSLQRSSVLKIILPEIQQDPRLFLQFIKEAQITARLEHPNIIPVHDMGVVEGDKLHFSMKEVQGDSLGRILRELKQGSEEYLHRYSQYTLLTLFRKICDAVAFAHSVNILHRDIKPDNIMVGDYGEVLLMDWGLARPIDQDDEPVPAGADDLDTNSSDIEATRAGIVKGSPAFMSPEQAAGQVDKIDQRSDIFLLGSTLYSIVTLHAPYVGDNVRETLANAQQGNFITPALRAPERELESELCRIIHKSMALKKEDRYQTVNDLIKDLDALLQGSISSITKNFAAGEFIITEGDIGEEAYVINKGTVEVLKKTNNGIMRLITLGPGNVIGEMALIANSARTASVRAIEPTELVIITKEVMNQGLGQLPTWLSTAVNCLTERLNKANSEIHPLISGDCTWHVLRQLQYIYLYWGKEKTDTFNQGKILCLGIQRVIDEISSCLCIPAKKVESIISRLLSHGLMRPYGSEEFTIANIPLFERLVWRANDQNDALDCPPDSSSSYAQTFQSYSIEQVIGFSDDHQVDRKLDEILMQIRDHVT